MAITYMRADSGRRSNWVYNYDCSEIAVRARTKAVTLLSEERGIEQALAACITGPDYSGRGEDLDRIRKRLRAKGVEREKCELMARELT